MGILALMGCLFGRKALLAVGIAYGTARFQRSQAQEETGKSKRMALFHREHGGSHPVGHGPGRRIPIRSQESLGAMRRRRTRWSSG